MEQQVRIELQTVIQDNGQQEKSTTRQLGHYYQKNAIDVLSFEEKHEDAGIIKNFITIQPDKVSIKRSGLISMTQHFRANQRTENVYTHPHGHLHMETYTKAIRYQSLEDGTEGRLHIIYTVKLNGQDERNHELTLTYNKEDES
ncbi:DUF1934 domain-containing protein [Ornithinibacillus contaminans]|uniref:DUF1934 domain-containing protein n=1 Tax=Ornithinibacillus contaminans TaxID=694055 RepID=UPI00064DFE15|nr:DUF1934 domain-containing protein [Ornithinibacillus contaminans]